MLRLICAAIGNAFAVLSDDQKRNRYDQYGSDETELRPRRRQDGYEYDFSRGFEGKRFCLQLHSSKTRQTSFIIIVTAKKLDW